MCARGVNLVNWELSTISRMGFETVLTVQYFYLFISFPSKEMFESISLIIDKKFPLSFFGHHFESVVTATFYMAISSETTGKFLTKWKLGQTLSPVHGKVYSIQNYVIKFVSDLLQISGFLRVLRFPPPIKLTATI